MVLVDTSVWIAFLAGRAPFASGLDRLLKDGEVVGHEFVFGELLVGDRGGRARLLADYTRLSRASVVAHGEVVDFVRHHRLFGRGVGWVDMHLLASARVGGFDLWTADPRFAAVARELRVEYTMSA